MDATEERRTILEMIENDKISAAEGLKLLEALGGKSNPSSTSPATTATKDNEQIKGRLFRVVVTNTVTGRIKTHVTLPMSLVNWGLKIGGHFSPEIEGINMNELSDILSSVDHGKIIDVLDEEDGEHVEIYID